jgi:hypothetical protein
MACASVLEQVRPPAVSPAIVPVLIAALGRPDQRVRAACCSLLMHFGPEARAAIPALIVLARQHPGALASPDPWPWDPNRLTIQALKIIVPRIRALQKDPDPAVRWAEEYALAKLTKVDGAQD